MNKVVSREEWLKARKELLTAERALTKQRDRLSEQRRALPWVKIEKEYIFQGPNGECRLQDLFEGRSQLFIYHFMLSPDSDNICSGCAFISDHVDAARQHFEQADLSFAAISRAQFPHIEKAKARMGWKFNWVSSYQSDFNYDFGVSFTKQQVESDEPLYNYGLNSGLIEDLHGESVFVREGDDIFHTYSSYSRGGEMLIGAFNFLDLVPKGRNETSTMSWVKLHDEYGKENNSCCCKN